MIVDSVLHDWGIAAVQAQAAVSLKSCAGCVDVPINILQIAANKVCVCARVCVRVCVRVIVIAVAVAWPPTLHAAHSWLGTPALLL